MGSVSSIAWKDICKAEKKANRSLYSVDILYECDDREEALEKELEFHLLYDVVKNPLFYNEALACPNGYFGRDVSGSNNPRFGVTCPENVRKALRVANSGKTVASSDNGESWQYITTEEFWNNRGRYITPKGAFNPVITQKTRERVAAGTHHFCDSEMQRKMREKRRANGFDVMTQEQKDKLSDIAIKRFARWGNKMFTADTRPIWLNADILYKYYLTAKVNGDIFTQTGKILRTVSSEIKGQFEKETGIKITPDRFSKVLIKFKQGWIPSEDLDYMEWKEIESK